MATPLDDLIHSVFDDSNVRAALAAGPEDFLRGHGWSTLDADDLREALLVLGDGSSTELAAQYNRSASAIDTELDGLSGAGQALAQASASWLADSADDVDPATLDDLDNTDAEPDADDATDADDGESDAGDDDESDAGDDRDADPTHEFNGVDEVGSPEPTSSPDHTTSDEIPLVEHDSHLGVEPPLYDESFDAGTGTSALDDPNFADQYDSTPTADDTIDGWEDIIS